MAYYRKTTIPAVKGPRFTPPGGWGPQFEGVFSFVTSGKGNGAIEAVAGGGKTTAIVESIIRYVEKNPGKKVLFVAFNVSIKEEGEKRLAGYPVEIVTCHGLGFRAVRKPSAWGAKQFDVQTSNGLYMQSLAEAEFGPEKEARQDREAFMDLVSKAKTCLVSDVEGLVELMDRFDIETDRKPEEFAEKVIKCLEFTAKHPGTSITQGRGRAKGRTFSKAAITFDDQVWLPVVNDWAVDTYDAVFVDEAQDLSASRRELVKRSLKTGGRMFACGDRKQAIFGFAGADIDSLPQLIEEFDCEILPLSCSFRCGKNIIAQAVGFNDVIEAAPNAIDGTVDKLDSLDLIDTVAAGDVVLSRTNAPLVKCFFLLARRQTKVRFIGRDYGRMLSYRIKGWQAKAHNKGYSFTISDLLDANDAWLLKTRQNRSKGEETVAASERHTDEHATVIVLTEGLDADYGSEAAVTEILDRCKAFSPEPGKTDDGSGYIALSSVHRFKGLERERAFLIADTFNVGSSQEEDNLMYVAVTRAKSHLTYVAGKDFVSAQAQAAE